MSEMNESNGRFQIQKFIKITLVMSMSSNDNLGGKKEFVKVDGKFNAMTISAYYPAQYDDGKLHSITAFISAGHTFFSDLTMEQFEKMMNALDLAYDITILEQAKAIL